MLILHELQRDHSVPLCVFAQRLRLELRQMTQLWEAAWKIEEGAMVINMLDNGVADEVIEAVSRHPS